MAAPALAASMALSAISRGDRGTWGLRSWVPPEPVTAQVMKTSRFMVSGIAGLPVRYRPHGARLAENCFSFYAIKMTEYELLSVPAAGDAPVKVDILVLPGSSMMTLACAGDPLRAANRVCGRTVFAWRFLSLDGDAPLTSAGTPWPVSGRIDPGEKRNVLAVVAGFRAFEMRDRRMLSRIVRASQNAELTIGIESGAWLIARAGLLDGRRATTHWEDFEEFATAFPAIDLRPDRTVADGRFITTAGASPTFDMMIDLIRRCAGMAAALDVASAFVYEASRGASDAQAPVSFGPAGNHDPRVDAGDPRHGALHRKAGDDRSDRTARFHVAARIGAIVPQGDRPDARRLFPVAEDQCGAEAGARYAASDDRDSVAHRLFLGCGVFARFQAVLRHLAAAETYRAGAGLRALCPAAADQNAFRFRNVCLTLPSM